MTVTAESPPQPEIPTNDDEVSQVDQNGDVIDVDSHFFEPLTWMRTVNPKLSDQLAEALPKISFADVFFGEILANLPVEMRDEARKALPLDFVAGANEELTLEAMEASIAEMNPILVNVLRQKGADGGADRVAACDEQGIGTQFIHPTFGVFDFLRVKANRPDLLGDMCEAYNSWTLQALDGHTDRLSPSVFVDCIDPARAVQELTRMRAAGARLWLAPLHPVDGKALSHPDLDRIWAASADLGMVPTFHIGLGNLFFDKAWSNTGQPDWAVGNYRTTVSLVSHVAQLPLCDLLFNGVFERHPDLTVLVSEFGVSWFQNFWERIWPTTHRLTLQTLMPWTQPLTAHEYITRNVRLSPLPGDPVDRFIADFGSDMLWFASDYPHPEGSPNAVSEYAATLEAATISPDAQEKFFAGSARQYLF